MKLTIKEIALLKQDPERYMMKQLSTTKTHDGTSTGGGFKEALNQFIEDYSQDPFCNTAIYDSKGIGNIIYRATYNTEDQLIGEGIDITEDKDYNPETDKDMHLFLNSSPSENPDGTRPGTYYWDGDSPIDKPNVSMIGFHNRDVEYLTEKNEAGEYLYRSTTIVSPNGKSMTLIKNNDFNDSNHETLMNIQEDMMNETRGYANMYQTQQALYIKEQELQYMKDNNTMTVPYEIKNRIKYDSHKYAQEQLGGDLYDYLDRKGFPKRFEEEANIKMRVKNNNGSEYKHYTSDAYYPYEQALEYEDEYEPYIIRETL